MLKNLLPIKEYNIEIQRKFVIYVFFFVYIYTNVDTKNSINM